jgi:DinB superfamily
VNAPVQRESLIRRYAEGPDRLAAALARVPAPAMQWRPAAGRWTVHEVIVHCADSETNAHMRLRYLLAEPEPLVLGYDQDRWAIDLDYHAHPLEPALATVRAVRANTVPLLERLTETDWGKTGRHTEHPSYGVRQWLEIYADHLEVHARQIERNVAAWERR